MQPQTSSTKPAAVLMIHSFSAADPTDPGTIAGRWLANGAFVFFGSMNEPGLQAFLQDPSLAGDATAEEIEFLKKLTFTRNRPTPLYYYRELQSLRDPLHFHRARTDAAAGDESLAARRNATGGEEK